MAPTVRLFYFFSILIPIACGQSNTSKTTVQAPEEYYLQEAKKGNVNDSLFLSFTFAMDSVSVVKHAEDMGCWRFYDTQSGRDRLYIQKKRLEGSLGHKLYGYEFEYNCDFRGKEDEYDIMAEYSAPYSPMDNYSYNSAFYTKIVLINEDGSYKEVYAPFGLSYYNGMLSDVMISLSGESDRDKNRLKPDSFFNSIVKTFKSKYGEPFILEDKKAEWVNGVIHITAEYYGIDYTHYDALIGNPRHYSLYSPLFTIHYRNYALLLQANKDIDKKRQEKVKMDEEEKAKEQADLEKRFNTSNPI